MYPKTALRISFALLFLSMFATTTLLAQSPASSVSKDALEGQESFESDARAIRRDMPIPNPIRNAYESGTRDSNGRPGPNYWQLQTDFKIDVHLNPETHTLTGNETITIHNTSPDELDRIVLRLDHNIFRPLAQRGASVPAETTDGMVITRLAIDGEDIDLTARGSRRRNGEPRNSVRGLTQTVATISLANPIPPSSKAELAIEWHTQLPGGTEGRGHRMTQRWEERLVQPTQWFPRLAKYDDLLGWDTSPYLGPAEFNNNFGSFDVFIDAPGGWIVTGTGLLQNPEEVLTVKARERLSTVLDSDEEITIVGPGEVGPGKSTAEGERLVWHFHADQVNDFAWAAAENYVWKATRATIPGKGPIPIHMVFLPERADRFERAGMISRHALEFYSKLWIPYPFPQLTMQDGPSAGMEYPMVINSNQGAADHEVGHQWWPMMLGTNETWYGWMDEGLNVYMNRLSGADLRGTEASYDGLGQSYGQISGNPLEPSMMHPANYSGSMYGFQTYQKAPLMLSMLGGIVGDDEVQRAIREYTEVWAFKHPSPWDFASFMSESLDVELDWFWYYWLWTTESVDGLIESVETANGKTAVTVRQEGYMPSPVVLKVEFASESDHGNKTQQKNAQGSNSMEHIELQDDGSAIVTWPVDVWFDGNREFQAVLVFEGQQVNKITLDPMGRFPDKNAADNTWELKSNAWRQFAKNSPNAETDKEVNSMVDDDKPSAESSAPLPSIVEKTKGFKKLEGFFDLYWDDQEERFWMEIEHWDQEFLYVTSTPANSSGSRGSWGGTKVQKFSRHGKKVFLTEVKFRYRAETNDEREREAVENAYYPTITNGFEVAAEEEGRALIDATSFFLKSDEGSVDRSRSTIHWPRTKNFPKNTEVEVTLTTTGSSSRDGEGGGSQDGQTIRRHHSLVELPDAGYTPREHDERMNMFSTRYLDYATPITEPIQKQMINRHRLVKKDPNAPVSEPVEPIVYYIDPGAPEPIRSALIDGASWWNQAFEEIGYKNAFRVEELPADADPMDLRYNMVLWIHRPTRGWSFGSSITDPRTGEIICGRVFLGSQRIRQDFLIGSGLHAPYRDQTADTEQIEEMALARIRQLSAHEIGHTLGFAHNFAASSFGRASVMDYPHPTIRAREDESLDFSDAYSVGVGEWDKVSVAYAYSHFPDGVNEKQALIEILKNAHARGMYTNQSVSPGSADPNTHQWDNGKDAMDEFNNVMQVRRIALRNLSEANIQVGKQMSSLEEVLVPIYLYHRYQTEAVSKILGGLDYRFAARGDGQMTFEIVSAERQTRALGLLLETLEPSQLEVPEHILKLLSPRSSSNSEELFQRHTSPMFDPLAAAESAADHTLTFLLNPSRAARLIQQHARDSEIPSLGEVIDQLLAKTWRSQAKSSPYHLEIRRAVDDVVLKRLMGLASNKNATTQVRAIAFRSIDSLKSWLGEQVPTEESQIAHFAFAMHLIEQFQKEPSKFEIGDPPDAPAGAPIGMGMKPFCALGGPVDSKK
ncbi:zinc-dependent metalloprotease [bacterium]|nr:zinc-dependent metalloprotease [bacterium]